MSIISFGLIPDARHPKKILRVISNNNRVSLAIKAEFEKLNSFTKSYLATQYEEEQQQQQQTPDKSLKQSKNVQLHDLFRELYVLIDCENFKLDRVANVNLRSLQEIIDKLQ